VQVVANGSSSAPNRRARRKARTRAALIGGARAVFARQGVDATAIAEITEEADVGFGSFYNHFASKEEIAEAVLTEVVAEQGAAVEQLTDELNDPAEVVSVAHRYFVRRARSDPDWARVLIRLDVSHRVATAALRPHARRDLDRGIKAGRFNVADRELALLATGGALLAVMRGVLDGELRSRADVHHAEGVLRALGLPLADAAEVARRPLPVRPAD
jgi:AcrR family transcriptional regulator